MVAVELERIIQTKKKKKKVNLLSLFLEYETEFFCNPIALDNGGWILRLFNVVVRVPCL